MFCFYLKENKHPRPVVPGFHLLALYDTGNSSKGLIDINSQRWPCRLFRQGPHTYQSMELLSGMSALQLTCDFRSSANANRLSALDTEIVRVSFARD